jgi:hypothetical protein
MFDKMEREIKKESDEERNKDMNAQGVDLLARRHFTSSCG